MDVIRWNQNFQEIQRYLEENHCTLAEIPKDVRAATGTVMRVWIGEMRKAYQNLASTNFHLNDEQKEKLRSIGMEEWINLPEREWLSHLMDVKAFYEEHHHFKLPTDMQSGNTNLYTWVVHQRVCFRNNMMSAERIQKIQEHGLMDMISFRDTPFESGFYHAKMFYEQNHHLQVPEDFECEDGYPLGNWICKMQHRFLESRLSQTCIRKLNRIGMNWKLKDSQFEKEYQQSRQSYEESYSESVTEEPQKSEKTNIIWAMNTQDFEVGYYHAELFYQENQHLFIPSTFICEDGFRLGVWIYNQRYKFEKNQLSPEEIERLNQIEMIWNVSAYFWNPNYQDCKAYYEKHGNLDIPADLKGTSGIFLSEWIQECQQEYQKGNFSQEQIEKLFRIGVLNLLSEKEENLFCHLKNFHEMYHHFFIPKNFVCEDGYPLGKQVSQIRAKYKKEQISKYFAEMLENIGFCWDYKEQIWMDAYEICRKYHEEHGDLKFPPDFKTSSGANLKVWLKLNRISYYKGELSPKRARLFEKMGGTEYILPRKSKLLQVPQEIPMEEPTEENQFESISAEFRTWQNYCMEILNFYEHFHHLSISADIKGADRIPLKYWFISQKNQIKLGRMSERKILFLKQHQLLDLFQSNI